MTTTMNQDTRPQKDRGPQPTADEVTPLTGGERYSAFTERQKRLIILTAALASTFSPFSANIYYPALNSIASDLHVSASLINLTIMTYMVIVIVFFFPAVYASNFRTLTMKLDLPRIGANICRLFIRLGREKASLRNLLHCVRLRKHRPGTAELLHSASSPACCSELRQQWDGGLASAVAADLVTSSERGKYMGLASLGSILGPTLGPILGGLLSQYLGWKSIFYFLAIFAFVFFLPLLLFYPETCRNVVGDSSVPPPAWNESYLNYRDKKARARSGIPPEELYALRDALAEKRHIKIPNPLTTLKLLFEVPTGPILLCNGILFAGYYFVTSSVPSQFQEIYSVNNLQIVLIFIAPGLGTPFGAWVNGHLVDGNFRRFAARQDLPVVSRGKQKLSNFPIEKARLQIALPMLYVGAFTIAVYGWMIHLKAPIAAAIFLLFLIGFTVTACFNVMNVLIVDLNYSTPATATAANNLVRCLLGAGSTALVHPLLNTLGRGWTYTFVAVLWISLSPILLLIYRWGFDWRKKRDGDKV